MQQVPRVVLREEGPSTHPKIDIHSSSGQKLHQRQVVEFDRQAQQHVAVHFDGRVLHFRGVLVESREDPLGCLVLLHTLHNARREQPSVKIIQTNKNNRTCVFIFSSLLGTRELTGDAHPCIIT